MVLLIPEEAAGLVVLRPGGGHGLGAVRLDGDDGDGGGLGGGEGDTGALGLWNGRRDAGGRGGEVRMGDVSVFFGFFW